MTSYLTDAVQLIGGAFGAVFGVALVFPKIGEAILTRLLSGSLEKQKAEYAKQLEAHKTQLMLELESVKARNTEGLERLKTALSAQSSQTARVLDLQMKARQQVREKLIGALQQSTADSDEIYSLASQICSQAQTLSELLPKPVSDACIQIDEYIEAPLSLNDPGFVDTVCELLSNALKKLDREETKTMGVQP